MFPNIDLSALTKKIYIYIFFIRKKNRNVRLIWQRRVGSGRSRQRSGRARYGSGQVRIGGLHRLGFTVQQLSLRGVLKRGMRGRMERSIRRGFWANKRSPSTLMPLHKTKSRTSMSSHSPTRISKKWVSRSVTGMWSRT